MIIRQIDINSDWVFGKGRNDYVSGMNAVIQNIDMRLGCFLGDCFFDLGAGLDWLNLLGTKDQTALLLVISATILNTANVTGILQLSVNVDKARKLTVKYSVQSTYSLLTNSYQYDLNGIA